MKEIELEPGWLKKQMDETRAEVAKWPESFNPLLSINSGLICKPCFAARPNDWVCQCPTEAADKESERKPE